MHKVLVSGGNGQLALSLLAVANGFPSLELHCLSKHNLDITDISQVRNRVREIQPAYFINAAAYTAVDDAENNIELAYAINEQGVSNIAQICEENEIPLIHISSDYVYHNGKNRPLRESDSTEPKGVYAQSKLAGEKSLQSINSAFLILRTSWVYSRYRKNFVKTMKGLLEKMEEVKVVNDQIGCPCWAEELAEVILSILHKDVETKGYIKNNSGIYNYTQLGTASWYDIVVALKRIIHSDTMVHAVGTSEFPRPARRPSYSVMSLDKFRQTFDLSLLHWTEALKDCVQDMD